MKEEEGKRGGGRGCLQIHCSFDLCTLSIWSRLPQFGYRQLDGLTFDHPSSDLEGTPMYYVIGTCRAVWVPGQDLAMPHLMRNCGKCILSLHSLYAIGTSVLRMHRPRVFASGPCDMSAHDSK